MTKSGQPANDATMPKLHVFTPLMSDGGAGVFLYRGFATARSTKSVGDVSWLWAVVLPKLSRLTLIIVTSGGFVYSGSETSVADVSDTTSNNSERIGYTPSAPARLDSPHPTLRQFPNVDSNLSLLLDYFIHVGSPSMCTHQKSRLETCQALIPISHTVPSLLGAILSYSAAHRMADHTQSTQPYDKTLITRLKLESIQRLREEVDSPASPPEGMLATSLMLLQCIAGHQDDDFAS